jgi:beta-glucosidase
VTPQPSSPAHDFPAFPRRFIWGASTASYQIEGAVSEDGRGGSVWDTFCAEPGRIADGSSGAVACDHYHRYRDDVALMRELNLKAYRFSVAWPRVLPEGRGRINEKGLDFYDRLVDCLLEAGIEPYATLYHWDLPQVLEDEGGWPVRGTIDAFAEFSEAVARRLGDRVRHWITHNEPWCAAWLGYGLGEHAPGRRSRRDALAACHNLLLSHGRAVEILRAECPEAEVGITLNPEQVYAASDSPADVAAARSVDGFKNRWFLDPLFHGTYPSDMIEEFGEDVPTVLDGDMDLISAPIDLLGVNTYSRALIEADPETGRPIHIRPMASLYTHMGWEVYPDGLEDLLVRLHEDYGPKQLYVTENGSSFTDVLTHDRKVLDPERTDYLQAHIEACARAIARGARLSGYFAWSLLDNFEWAFGYQMRFGIVYVDYPSLERVPKASARWYASFIRSQSEMPASRTA